MRDEPAERLAEARASDPGKLTRRGRALLVKHRALGLAAAGGVLFALSAPPTDLLAGVLVGLGLLAAAMGDATRMRSGLCRGAVWASCAGLVGLRFVPSVIQLFTDLGTVAAVAAHILLAIGQSLNWALGMALTAVLRRRLRAPLELGFGAGVLASVWLPSVFVWSPAALLTPWTVLIQSAELVGERGVSVLLAVEVALVVRAAAGFARARGASLRSAREAWAAVAGAVGLLALMLGHGAWALRHYGELGEGAEAQVAIGLVHAGINPKERWEPAHHARILHTLKAQTAAVEQEGVELSIWPEAAFPYRLAHGARRGPRGPRALLGDGVHGPILFGLITVEPPKPLGRNEQGRMQYERNRLNSATLVAPDGALQPPYDKMQLLWFGETVPLSEYLPWLRRLFQRSGGLVPGRELRALTLHRQQDVALRMGVLNCYEDTLPDLGRRIARELGPNLLVNITNDAWFIGTSEPELHLRLSVMRAVELRRDLVRAVNLGVASWIDARGVVRARYDSAQPGYLVVRPHLRSGRTAYGRWGDWPVALLLLAGSLAAWRRKR